MFLFGNNLQVGFITLFVHLNLVSMMVAISLVCSQAANSQQKMAEARRASVCLKFSFACMDNFRKIVLRPLSLPLFHYGPNRLKINQIAPLELSFSFQLDPNLVNMGCLGI